MNHFVEKCSCGIVLSQCRCPGHKREMVSPIPCPHQPKPMTDQRARAEQLIESLSSNYAGHNGNFIPEWTKAYEKDLGLIASALADERRRVWEEAKLIADTVAVKHPAPEDWMARLAAVSISNLMDAKAHAGQEG